MRQLLLWITALITSISVLLIGVRAAHPNHTSTACIQLLSPLTGDVLTVDANSGAALLDARRAFPLPITRTSILAPVSPDRTHVIDTADMTNYGPPAHILVLRRRSTTYRRTLTPASHADTYLWSPDSHYIAFTELRGYGAGNLLANLVTTDVKGTFVKREAIPIVLENSWFLQYHRSLWSPDSTMLALPINQPQSPGLYFPNSVLALRPVAADKSIYVSLPNQHIVYTNWSPDSQFVFVFVRDGEAKPNHMIYIIRRDGQIIKQAALFPGFTPFFKSTETYAVEPQWSPDGQYFYLFGQDPDQTTLDIFNVSGDRMLPAPIRLPHTVFLWTALPHTLLYIIDHGDNRTLESLDVETGQIIILAEHIAEEQSLNFSPDDTSMAIITSPSRNRIVPRVISSDLSENTTPFGELESYGYVPSRWSPDNQTYLLTVEDNSTFTVTWVQAHSDGVKSIRLPKQTDQFPENLNATWLTNDAILLEHSTNQSRTVLRLNTRTSDLTSLLSTSTDKYVPDWHDKNYLTMRRLRDLRNELYRLTDGAVLFSNIDYPRVGGNRGNTIYVAPNERAALLFGERYDNLRPPTLSLITADATQLLTTADSLTHPAWSSDSELFAFAAIEQPNTRWTLHVMSPDGKLLRSFPLPTAASTTPYQQARWTTCG